VEQENYLPPQIRSHLQQLEFISSKSIKDIELPQCHRRPSNFLRNLHLMQQLAKKQEEKYTGMLR
jgi:hypothetical protein